ncbi:AAA family ATPase [Bartonella sp. CB189]|uniref:AAA family ATPase n=1 Tax=Bartonella sp. CB189 TaxID=3112254 RepID=UPI002F96DC6E
MIFTSFKLENFRGISQPVEIDFTKGNQDFPFVLVGNNESGKTTILKGINFISVLCRGKQLPENFFVSIRPKSSYFNGDIILSACLSCNNDDMSALKSLKTPSKKLICKDITNSEDGKFELSFIYPFKNSACDEGIICINKKQIDKDDSIMGWIAERTPEIVYYDDFMFEVPDKIRFSRRENGAQDLLSSSEKNYQWQMILNDFLIGSYYIHACVKDEKAVLDVDFQRDIIDCNDVDAIDQRMASINDYLNSIVKEDWENITKGKSVFDSCVIERSNSSDGNFVDFCLKVKAKNRSFSLYERSKGFRWFFCFKVFTEVRRHRSKNGVVFLLDEPANNLHIRLQENILDFLKNLSRLEGNKVIYSTHSPYLINQNEQDNLFSVRNEASDFELPRVMCNRFLELDTSTKEAQNAVEPIIQKVKIYVMQKISFSSVMKMLRNIHSCTEIINKITENIKKIIESPD